MTTIQTERVILKSPNDDSIILMMRLGKSFIKILDFWNLGRDKELAHITFARIFEDSGICGSSGVANYITEIQVGKEEEKSNPTVPSNPVLTHLVMALTTIELSHYEFLRQEAENKSGRGPFPTFDRVGC